MCDYFGVRSLETALTSMITSCRTCCRAAIIGLLTAASAVLAVPQHAAAESRLHVSSPDEPPTGSILAPAIEDLQSAGGQAIHADMARSARSGGKPEPRTPSQETMFAPAARKPAPSEMGSMPPMPTTPTEPEPAEEAVAARPPEAAASTAPTMEAGSESQQTALPPAWRPTQPWAMASLTFAPDSAALSGDAERTLEDLAARFPANDGNVRLQLLAYASGEGMSASKARRLSLARALAVRTYLTERGIDNTRMDVRALGDKILGSPDGGTDTSPANRVDIAMIRR